MPVFNSFSELIGHTPLFRLHQIERIHQLKARLLAKVEYLNPAGSTKDRAALFMINDAVEHGLLKPGSVIIEPTSGNTGIGLAAVAAAMGFRVILTMPDTMSLERRKLLSAYGAELVLTDGSKGMQGAVERAIELSSQIENSFIPGQFENPANAQAHYKTTGPEIWEDSSGEVDCLVAGVGTGGTITGTARYLKEQNPGVYVTAVEPASSPLLSEERSGPHGIQGIGANFVPALLDRSVIDEIITVSDEAAIDTSKQLLRSEGLLTGISSGAALAAAIELGARSEFDGKSIVVILPDSGDRYLSTALFS